MTTLNGKKKLNNEQFNFINLKTRLNKYDFHPKYFDISKKDTVDNFLNSLPKKSIAYLGTGDFHYISYFLIKRFLLKPMLVLFDNHFDMDKTDKYVITCGSWVRNCIEENLTSGLLIIGSNKKYMPKDILDCSFIQYIEDGNKTLDFNIIKKIEGRRVYISVDKDVLKDKIVKTSWDQGDMELVSLVNWLKLINRYCKVLGVDICGEAEHNPLLDIVNPEININNRKIDKKISEIFLN